MGTVTYTFLNSGGGEGWSATGGTFSSQTYVSNKLIFYQPTATSGTYSGAMTQSATAKTYENCGVPVGSKVIGIRLLAVNTATIAGSTLTGESIQVVTNEADLGTYDIYSNPFVTNTDPPLTINKNSSDYIQLGVAVSANIDTDFSGDYQSLEIDVNQIQVEFTYQSANKNKMMFII